MIKKLLLIISILSLATTCYAFDVPTANYTADAYDKLLIHADQADGTAGTDIIDSATSKTITAVADAQVDTAQYKDLTGSTGSILFDGTGDYCTLADSADWNLGTGAFTIDFWVRCNALTADMGVFTLTTDTTETLEISIAGQASDRLLVVANLHYLNSADVVLSVDTWYHVALVRSGDTLSLYMDGVLKDYEDVTGVTYNSTNKGIAIGYYYNPASYHFNGWIDEFRISKGIARDWAPADTGDVMIIQYVKNFINNLNPDKIGTPMWSCKIKLMGWWRNGKLPFLQS